MRRIVFRIVCAILSCALTSCLNNNTKESPSLTRNRYPLIFKEDSVLFTRAWKSPSVYLMEKPTDDSISAWKKMCETLNPDYNHVMIPPYMDGVPMEKQVTFYDLAIASSIEESSREDAFILWRLNEFMPSNSEPTGEVQRYKLLCAQMDSLLTCNGIGSQMDYNFNSYLEAEFAWIRVNEYQKRLCDAIPSSAEVLNEEFASWKEYISAADNAFEKIQMGLGFQGSASPMSYSGFRSESMEMLSQALIPFYLMISDPKNAPEADAHGVTTLIDVDDEYQVFLSSIVKKMTEEKDSEFFDPNSYYPLKEQTAALEKDQSSWQKWMEAREKVAESLEGDLQLQYENATNNIRRRKLIDLKNRYEGYGITSEFILGILLKYDCSDAELSEHNYEQLWDNALITE